MNGMLSFFFDLGDEMMFQLRHDSLIRVLIVRYGFWSVVPLDHRSFHERVL